MKRSPDEAPERESGEPFVSRWSRRKVEARQAPAPAKQEKADPKSPAPVLPAVDQLTMESDFRAFFHPKVDEGLRRAALKKLFSDPHFNVMDGLDVYIDDYSKTEPIPPEMLAGLRQAQNILRWAREDEEARAKEQHARVPQQPLQDAPTLEPPEQQSPQAAEPRPDSADAAFAPSGSESNPTGSS